MCISIGEEEYPRGDWGHESDLNKRVNYPSVGAGRGLGGSKFI